MNKCALFFAYVDVIPGKEPELNDWYDNHHIPEYAGKLPLLKSVKRFYSKKSAPEFLAIYEYDSFDDLKKSLASEEAKAAGEDANKQVGVLIKSISYKTLAQIY